MKILAFDTSTEYLSIALRLEGKTLLRECVAEQKHSSLLLPMVSEVLAEAEISLSQLDCIAFGVGPGSFTGLRIACSVAQGLAFGAGIPLIGISTLQALAQACGARRVIAAMDARMGEIYHAAYEKSGDTWREVMAPTVCKPEQAPLITGDDWVGVGSGFAAYEMLQQHYANRLTRIDAKAYPHASAMLELAVAEFAAGHAVAPEYAAPVYIRNKVAITHAEQQQRIKA
jgi:tRNA threonylcarbamoyladenosine biosynthesis protein TsaB